MATQRYVSTSFWRDQWVLDLDPVEKLVYLYLLTCVDTNIAGIYQIAPKTAAIETGIDRDAIEKILRRFHTDCKALYINGWVILPNWPRHQRYHERQKVRKGIENTLNELPNWLKYGLASNQIPYEFDRSFLESLHSLQSPISYPELNHTKIGYELSESESETDQSQSQIGDTLPREAPASRNSDGDQVIVETVEIAEDSPLTETELYPVKKPSRMSDELADQFETLFWAVNGQPAAIAKERSHCKKLATVCRARSPDDEASYAQAIVEKFYELRKRSRKSYWRCPFDAANLVSKFNAVADELERSRREQQQAAEMEDVF